MRLVASKMLDVKAWLGLEDPLFKVTYVIFSKTKFLANCWQTRQEVLVAHHLNLCKYPHDMTAGFPQWSKREL